MQSSNDLNSLLVPSDRFQRSVDLARDYHDPRALEGYFLTDFGRRCLSRIGEGLLPNSSRRCWRLTGHYGTGKSSFGLLLASALKDAPNRLPRGLFNAVSETLPSVRRDRYLPILVVGSREPMGLAILRSLLHALNEAPAKGKRSATEQELSEVVEKGASVGETKINFFLEWAAEKLVSSGRAKGLVLILDEVGKFLEYAALNPDQQDIYLFQRLAETAARSRKAPILLVCFLHQGFNAYADQLNVTAQREWEKVASRFEEIVFEQPLDQITLIVASALNTKVDKLDEKTRKQAAASMEQAIELGWFGTAASKKSLRDKALGIFPIDPLVLPILVRVFQRFGQNERSLFSFLFSFEPFGLRAFCSSERVNTARPYRLHDFYDYVRTNFGHRLAVASYRSRWSVIESNIDSFTSNDPLDHAVLKTIGILNVLNADDLAPTDDLIVWAVAGANKAGHEQVLNSLKNLRKRQIVYYRGHAKSYCLWAHTSVDLEARYEEAKRTLSSIPNISSSIQDRLDPRPLVARRHYIESGNLRYFKVDYCPADELEQRLQTPVEDADGVVIVPLCENDRGHKKAIKIAGEHRGNQNRIQLVAVPQPLDKLSGVVLEALRWDWVMANTPELNHDGYAREEVSRYLDQARNNLAKRVQEYIGLNRLGGHTSLTWFYRGAELPLHSGRQLLTKLSDLCDKVYKKAPRICNELVNRNSPSSAATGARMRLIELMFSRSELPFLGMPDDKKPPEKSMYLSVLLQAELHRQIEGVWKIAFPTESDPCQILPSLDRIRELIQTQPDTRVSVEKIISELRQPPYGLRDGLIPILLAVIAISGEQEVALYENGTFLREMGKDAFLRMTKNPKNFDIQYCKIEGVRSELFTRLAEILAVKGKSEFRVELLDVVRNLCVFVARLPEYARNTKRLSKSAVAVRDVILRAQEPVRMVFHDLPVACGYSQFEMGSVISNKEAQKFVLALKQALDELREAFPNLADRMVRGIVEGFDANLKDFVSSRRSIANRSEALLLHVKEIKLKAFCLRIFDAQLEREQWLESMGNFLALRPPSKWRDEEEDLFERELDLLIGRFKRTESIVFKAKSGKSLSSGIRVAVTHADGTEKQEVIHFSSEEESQLREIQGALSTLMGKNKRLGLAAASRAIWSQLKDSGEMS